LLDASQFTLPLVAIDPLLHGLYTPDRELIGHYDAAKIV
jgi:hypothetical protein